MSMDQETADAWTDELIADYQAGNTEFLDQDNSDTAVEIMERNRETRRTLEASLKKCSQELSDVEFELGVRGIKLDGAAAWGPGGEKSGTNFDGSSIATALKVDPAADLNSYLGRVIYMMAEGQDWHAPSGLCYCLNDGSELCYRGPNAEPVVSGMRYNEFVRMVRDVASVLTSESS